jgi:hypothetical protein
VAADRWSGPALWRSMILYKGDISSHVSDCAPASAQDFLGWFKAALSPFYPEGDLAGTPRLIRTERAQTARFSGGTGCSQAGYGGSQARASPHSHQACAAIGPVLR